MSSNFWVKLKNNTDFRIKLFLFLSLIFNLAYALFLFVISQVYYSKWFFVLSVYYDLLFAVRVYIFFQLRTEKDLRKKIRIMRSCGYFLFLLNLVVSVMLFVLIYSTYSIQYHEIIVITLATYTFASLTMAIIGRVKYLKKQDYLYVCIKIIRLASVSVSMVALTNTMLATFGENTTLLRSIILPILSGVVAVFIILCALLMIKKANLDLKVVKNEEK